LSIVTLGIYSAWAKVRRTRYFYENTILDGSSFDYHGNPIAILKGRIIAIAFIVAYKLTFNFSLALGLCTLAILMLAMPWLVWKSLQFKLYNSSYRGIRFGFGGTIGRVYFVYLLLPILTLVSLYLLMPFTHQRMKKFQHEESRFGVTHFSFDGTVGRFYLTYLIGFLIAVAGVIAICVGFSGTLTALFMTGGLKHAGPSAAGTFVFFMLALYAWMFSLFPLFLTLIQNLIWNNTKLGAHRFTSEMKWSKMTFIGITNIIGVVLTLGLLIPFAHIRALKYRIESMSLQPAGSLDNFIADAQAQTSATSEGMADLLDFDLSL
jgi:uncharacterized membrane protein YjgN (DUF898 family)